MLKRIALVFLAALSMISLVQIPASADSYYLLGRFNVLQDKYINAYVNPGDAKNHDGWCYKPEKRQNRVNSWSCTVADHRSTRGLDPKFFAYPNGAYADLGGRRHRAYLSQPVDRNYLPYCRPDYYEDGRGVIWPAYYCAYFVPA